MGGANDDDDDDNSADAVTLEALVKVSARFFLSFPICNELSLAAAFFFFFSNFALTDA